MFSPYTGIYHFCGGFSDVILRNQTSPLGNPRLVTILRLPADMPTSCIKAIYRQLGELRLFWRVPYSHNDGFRGSVAWDAIPAK